MKHDPEPYRYQDGPSTLELREERQRRATRTFWVILAISILAPGLLYVRKPAMAAIEQAAIQTGELLIQADAALAALITAESEEEGDSFGTLYAPLRLDDSFGGGEIAIDGSFEIFESRDGCEPLDEPPSEEFCAWILQDGGQVEQLCVPVTSF